MYMIKIWDLLLPKSMNETNSKSTRVPMDRNRNIHSRVIIFDLYENGDSLIWLASPNKPVERARAERLRSHAVGCNTWVHHMGL